MTSSHPKPMFNWFLGKTVFLTGLAWPGLQNWVNISTILIPDWAAITPPSCGTLRASSWTGQPSSAAWDGYSEKYHFDTHKHRIWYWCWLLLLQARGGTFLSFFAKYSPTCIQLTWLVQGTWLCQIFTPRYYPRCNYYMASPVKLQHQQQLRDDERISLREAFKKKRFDILTNYHLFSSFYISIFL